MSVSAPVPEELLGSTTDEYRTLVTREVFGETEAAGLSDDVERWYATLVEINRDVAVQLSNRKADLAEFRQECLRQGEEGKTRYFESQAAFEDWRGRALGFKRHVERRLSEVKLLRNEARNKTYGRPTEDARGVVAAILTFAEMRNDSERSVEDIWSDWRDWLREEWT